ncbi:unnamed protein product [Nezara viridula]|uniref:Uncharacterized protein n=1 Tax=Nezara viridula TaxID=85310 RepID=A0A9P0H7Z7_NEZVI|nr:unnamed protein product [Nezara viridula]
MNAQQTRSAGFVKGACKSVPYVMASGIHCPSVHGGQYRHWGAWLEDLEEKYIQEEMPMFATTGKTFKVTTTDTIVLPCEVINIGE